MSHRRKAKIPSERSLLLHPRLWFHLLISQYSNDRKTYQFINYTVLTITNITYGLVPIDKGGLEWAHRQASPSRRAIQLARSDHWFQHLFFQRLTCFFQEDSLKFLKMLKQISRSSPECRLRSDKSTSTTGVGFIVTSPTSTTLCSAREQ